MPRRSPILLLLFAGFVAAPAWGAAVKPGKEVPRTLDKDVTVHVHLNYLLFLPEGYGEKDKKWPLILFLHGAGETGANLDRVKVYGPPKLVQTKKDFPFIVVSPQSPGFGWNVDALTALLDEVESKYQVDPDRVYLTGLSMGGSGTWALAAAHPERFAAIVPICGRAYPAEARRLEDLPIWVFHGAKDPTVPIAQSENMVKALEEVGADVRFTVYPEAGHDAWTQTYNNPELYRWLLQHKRKAEKE